MDKQTFTRTVTQSIIIQLAMLHLLQSSHYRIAGRVEGPRALSLNLQIRQQAVSKFSKLPVKDFSLGCRQALRVDDPLPIRITDGPDGTLSIEIAKPQMLWIDDIPASMLDSMGQGLVVPVGVDASGTVATLDFANPLTPHGLVAGVPGSGKTNELLAVVRSLARQNDPRDVRFIFVDASTKRGRDFRPLARLAHRACEPITDLAVAEQAIAWALGEMARRGDQDYDTPHIFIIVDEIIDLLNQNPDLANPLARISLSGRALGVHLILVAHNPTKENIKNRDLAAYAPTRLVGKVADDTAARVATGLSRSGAEGLTGSGDMLYINPARSASLVRIVGPLVTRQDIEALPRADHVAEINFGGLELITSVEKMRGRPADPVDWGQVGRIIGYLADCHREHRQPKSASTLGKELSPMWSEAKMQRHMEAAKRAYVGLLDYERSKKR